MDGLPTSPVPAPTEPDSPNAQSLAFDLRSPIMELLDSPLSPEFPNADSDSQLSGPQQQLDPAAEVNDTQNRVPILYTAPYQMYYEQFWLRSLNHREETARLEVTTNYYFVAPGNQLIYIISTIQIAEQELRPTSTSESGGSSAENTEQSSSTNSQNENGRTLTSESSEYSLDTNEQQQTSPETQNGEELTSTSESSEYSLNKNERQQSSSDAQNGEEQTSRSESSEYFLDNNEQQSSFTRQNRKKRTGKSKPPPFCEFCKTNGEPKDFFKSHVLRDTNGVLKCPILSNLVCPICKATGQDSHTRRYCPMNNGNKHGPTNQLNSSGTPYCRRRT